MRAARARGRGREEPWQAWKQQKQKESLVWGGGSGSSEYRLELGGRRQEKGACRVKPGPGKDGEL